jgi:hypothetical protein
MSYPGTLLCLNLNSVILSRRMTCMDATCYFISLICASTVSNSIKVDETEIQASKVSSLVNNYVANIQTLRISSCFMYFDWLIGTHK